MKCEVSISGKVTLLKCHKCSGVCHPKCLKILAAAAKKMTLWDCGNCSSEVVFSEVEPGPKNDILQLGLFNAASDGTSRKNERRV